MSLGSETMPYRSMLRHDVGNEYGIASRGVSHSGPGRDRTVV
jgi:hypothetical protein